MDFWWIYDFSNHSFFSTPLLELAAKYIFIIDMLSCDYFVACEHCRQKSCHNASLQVHRRSQLQMTHLSSNRLIWKQVLLWLLGMICHYLAALHHQSNHWPMMLHRCNPRVSGNHCWRDLQPFIKEISFQCFQSQKRSIQGLSCA